MAGPHAELDDWDEPPRIYFSGREIAHLLIASVVLTLGMSLVLGGRPGEVLEFRTDLDVAKLLALLPLAAIAVVPAFILHELAHKVLAQRRDMFAEFQANLPGLGVGIVATFLLKFLLMVPGVVQIYGDADRRDAGIISIVGPGVNLIIGYLALGVGLLFAPHVRVGDIGSAGVGDYFQLVAYLNAILAAFNMLPFGPLDGRKVFRWSVVWFAAMWLLVVGLFAAAIF